MAPAGGLKARIETCFVPAGRFLMGSDKGRADERPARWVDLRAFHIARTPITNAQYAPFLWSTGTAAPPWWDHPDFCAADQPVVGVTWHDAVAFAAWLSKTIGGRWRLPCEAEWERAIRGGLEGEPTPWGSALPDDEVPQGPLSGPWAVGQGTPNGFDVLDPGTVVHEWCLDSYEPGLDSPRATDPPPRRASRGGSWRHRVRWSPPSARSSLPPDLRYADYGFRVLREVGP
jgi:formylglycine-generating enzyme required for sulfatase activity